MATLLAPPPPFTVGGWVWVYNSAESLYFFREALGPDIFPEKRLVLVGTVRAATLLPVQGTKTKKCRKAQTEKNDRTSPLPSGRNSTRSFTVFSEAPPRF